MKLLRNIFTLLFTIPSLLMATGSITGTVKHKKSAIEGATVTLLQNNIEIDSTVTDSSGEYNLINIPEGQYDLRANASGYQTKIKGIKVKDGKQKTSNFSLGNRPSTIEGFITDANDSSAISGAFIKVTRKGILLGSTLTNVDGSYSFSGLSKGSHIATVSASSYQTQSVGVRIKKLNTSTTVSLALKPFPGEVVGTVTDSNSLPIEGVLLELLSGDTVELSAQTDSNGEYTLSDIAPGSYSVRASKNEYQTKILGTSVSANASTTLDFSLQLKPGSIEGKVTNSSGSLVLEGATIQVFSNDTVIASALTDDEGLYFISGIAPGSYTVTTSFTDFQSITEGVIIESNKTAVANFALVKAPGEVSGVIKDNSSKAIAGASVVIRFENEVISSTLTDTNGEYKFDGIAPGSYIVTASKSSFQTKTIAAQVTSNKTTSLNFTLIANPGLVSGIVKDTSGNTLSGAKVIIRSGNANIANVFTDDNGKYTILGIAPGVYSISASATSYQTQKTGVIVVSDKTTTVNYSLKANPGSLTGVIKDSSKNALSGVNIVIYSGSAVIETTVTNSVGKYSISGLTPGSYTVSVTKSNFQGQTIGALVKSDQSTTLNFALVKNPGAVKGNVVDVSTKKALSGQSVTIRQKNTIIASAFTDSDGNYIVNNLRPGSYNVTIDVEGYQSQIIGVIIESDSLSAVNFSMVADVGKVVGTVIDSVTTDPISDANVSIKFGNSIISNTTTDSDGNFEFSGMSPGSYIISVNKEGFQDAIGLIIESNKTSTVNFSLNLNTNILSGVVTNETTGEPISGAVLEITRENVVLFSSLTDDQGAYEVRGIPSGSYTIHIHQSEYQMGLFGAIIGDTSVTGTGANLRSNDVLNFQLATGPATLTGQVVSEADGSAVSGASVEIFKDHYVLASTFTDENGMYSIDGLFSGVYSIRAYKDTFQMDGKNVTLTEGQVTTENFSMPSKPSTLKGQVLSKTTGQPVTSALVEAHIGHQNYFFTITDDSGNYLLEGLPSGHLAVHSHSLGYQTLCVDIMVADNTTTIFNFHLDDNPATVKGIVTDGITSDPISGAFVTATEIDIGDSLEIDLTSEGGAYLIEGLPTQDFFITASRNGYVTKNTDPIPISEGETYTRDITLYRNDLPARNISGKVIINRFLLQADRVHRLDWEKSLNPEVVQYRIYRNEELLSKVNANRPLVYEDHNRNAEETDVYSVVAENSDGTLAPGIEIELR